MNDLQVIEHKNERVLLTSQLAEGYETEANNIKNNFNNHKTRFTEGKHYYLLQGEELRAFKHEVNNIDLVPSNVNKLYLWNEKGTLRHAKILDTDKAWEVYERLEDTYFRVKAIQQLPVSDGVVDIAQQMALSITGVIAPIINDLTGRVNELERENGILDSKFTEVLDATTVITQLVRINSKQTRKLTKKIKSVIEEAYSIYNTSMEHPLCKKAKGIIFDEFNITTWEEIEVSKYNDVMAFIEIIPDIINK